jgi:hypothetical protein
MKGEKMNKRILIICLLISAVCLSNENCIAAGQLIQKINLVYEGAFRLPQGGIGTSSFNDSGASIAFRPPNGSNGTYGSIFIVGNLNQNKVAEIQIPALSKSSNIGDLNTATLLQTFSDITQGNLTAINNTARTAATGGVGCGGVDLPARSTVGAPCGESIYIGGLMTYGTKLIGTAFDYYDGGSPTFQYYSQFVANQTLSSPNFSGFYRGSGTMIDGQDIGRFLAGSMAKIPTEWQTPLGGKALTGLSTIPIISKTSYGPSAFVFNPDDLTNINTAFTATPVLYYDQQHQTLGNYDHQNSTYNATALMHKNMVFPNGTSSVLYFGTIGTGTYCYGNGSSNIAYINTPGCDPGGTWSTDKVSCIGPGDLNGLLGLYQTYCYDPDAGGGKGPHAWPYNYQVWAYDANDLAMVKAGAKNPWEVQPYGVWDLTSMLPFARTGGMGWFDVGGADYDPVTKRIYVVQGYGDGGYPVIYAFKQTIVPRPANLRILP